MNGWAVIAASITVSGSILTLVISIIVSDRQKRRARLLEILLARCDDQVSKFYAPLSNLVEQLDATDDLKKQMVEKDKKHENEINAITYRKYFLSIHRKIAEVFEENLHLVEGIDIPPSFIEYHKHVASERVFFSLLEDIEEAKSKGQIPEGADASKITCEPIKYPEPDFKNDIKAGLQSVLIRQEEIVKLLDKELIDLLKMANPTLASQVRAGLRPLTGNPSKRSEEPQISN